METNTNSTRILVMVESEERVNQLLAIEQAAKALFPDFLQGASDIEAGGCECDPCYRDRAAANKLGTDLWQSPRCLFTKLAQALGVTP